MRIIKTKGIVIKEYTVGESDKFISIFTKSNGKIMITAPRAKSYNRGLASGTQLFVYGEFVLQEYKDNYKLLQVEVIEAFHPLREDLERLSYSAYILEFIDVTMVENMSAPEVLRLMVRTFQAMCRNIINPKLIRHIFELKHMSISGYMPNLMECNECGILLEQCTTLYFDSIEGSVSCYDCAKPSPYCNLICADTLYTMRYIISVPVDDVFKFTVSDKVLYEISKVMSTYTVYHIDKKFKTLEFINQIERI